MYRAKEGHFFLLINDRWVCGCSALTRASWALFPFADRGRQRSGTLVREDGRLTFGGWMVVVTVTAVWLWSQ